MSQSVPEILDGYVSTIAEPFEVFKCNPPSNCLSKKWYFSWGLWFLWSGGFGFLKSSLVNFLGRPRGHELCFLVNFFGNMQQTDPVQPNEKGSPFKKKKLISFNKRLFFFWRCFFIGFSSFLDEKTAAPRLFLVG